MNDKVILVSCVKEKLSYASAADTLYCSDWFLLASRYASAHTERWFILSAKHGLVHPKRVLEPYDVTLNTMSTEERRQWAERVFGELQPQLKAGDTVEILAGKPYREYLAELIEQAGVRVEVPIDGMSNDEQMRWFEQRI